MNESRIQRRCFTALTLAFAFAVVPSQYLAATAPQQNTNADQVSGWTEFDFYKDSRIFLPVTINGYQTFGVLDSGAGVTAVDAEVAQAAGIEARGNMTATGTGGGVRVQVGNGVTLGVGGRTLSNLTVAVLDLSDVADRLLGRPLPVIIGAEFFNEFIVDIDFARHRIAFRDPGAWTYGGTGTRVPLIPRGQKRLVEVAVEQEEPILAGFDIGQGTPLTILKRRADSERFLNGRQYSTVRAGGVGGSAVEFITTARSITFGGYVFEHVPTIVPSEPRGAFNTTTMDANLGTELFSRFRMIVDFSRNHLMLEPYADSHTRAFLRNRSGVQIEKTSRGFEVVHVAESSPAANAGLIVGGIIGMIDGERLDDRYWTGNLWRWNNKPVGTTVVLTLTSGKQYSLVLADYY